MISHLYVHVPFCPKVCPYCSFFKEAGGLTQRDAYVDGVLAEAQSFSHLLRPRTIFFGGGTPTALSIADLRRLISGLRKRIDVAAVEEFTVEMNPATVSLEKAGALRELGVNRASLGVQSWSSRLLETLGRVHSAAAARASYAILRQAGFENINLDFIFGIPGQSLADWEATLAETIALGPDHISAYCLTYEEDTEYFRRFTAGDLVRHPDHEADLFEMTMLRLAEAGYDQYEISNYARSGRECLHNLAYWTGEDYLGLGPGAFSTVAGKRWRNVEDTPRYAAAVTANNPAADSVETIDEATARTERIAFSLRTRRGVAKADVPRQPAAELAGLGLLAGDDQTWRLTRKGRLLADSVAEALL